MGVSHATDAFVEAENRTPLCGHLSLLISAELFLAALMKFVKRFLKIPRSQETEDRRQELVR